MSYNARNWDPKKHPRNFRTGQFSENWVHALSGSMERGGSAPEPEPEPAFESEKLRRFRNMYGSRTFKRDVTTWDRPDLEYVVEQADELLAENLDDLDREKVDWVREQVSDYMAELAMTPPWEGGYFDDLEHAEKFQDLWVEKARAYLDSAGIDPVKWERMAQDYDGGLADSYHENATTPPEDYVINIISETLDAMGPGGTAGDAQRDFLADMQNSMRHWTLAMTSYDYPDAKEFKAHHLTDHPDYLTRGIYEILTPDGEWSLLEDAQHDEEQQEMTIWAGDHHYTIDDTEDVFVRAPEMPELGDLYVER